MPERETGGVHRTAAGASGAGDRRSWSIVVARGHVSHPGRRTRSLSDGDTPHSALSSPVPTSPASPDPPNSHSHDLLAGEGRLEMPDRRSRAILTLQEASLGKSARFPAHPIRRAATLPPSLAAPPPPP